MSDQSAEATTRVRERTELKAETVQETEHYCSHCSQWFDEDEMVNIGIGYREDKDVPWKKDKMCRYCVNSIYGYDKPTGLKNQFEDVVDRLQPKQMATFGGLAIATVVVLGGVLGILIHGSVLMFESILHPKSTLANPDAAVGITLILAVATVVAGGFMAAMMQSIDLPEENES